MIVEKSANEAAQRQQNEKAKLDMITQQVQSFDKKVELEKLQKLHQTKLTNQKLSEQVNSNKHLKLQELQKKQLFEDQIIQSAK